jgi:hypothetical protein
MGRKQFEQSVLQIPKKKIIREDWSINPRSSYPSGTFETIGTYTTIEKDIFAPPNHVGRLIFFQCESKPLATATAGNQKFQLTDTVDGGINYSIQPHVFLEGQAGFSTTNKINLKQHMWDSLTNLTKSPSSQAWIQAMIQSIQFSEDYGIKLRYENNSNQTLNTSDFFTATLIYELEEVQ